MRRLLLFMIVVAGVVTTLDLFASGDRKDKNKQTKAKFGQQVESSLESKNYEIVVDRVLTSKGATHNLTSGYSLKIDKDSLYSMLPYFGRAYSIPSGGGSAMIFDAIVTEYRVKDGRKGAKKVRLRARSEEDSYLFNIEIYSNGSCNIFVSSNNRQAISYFGKIKFDEK